MSSNCSSTLSMLKIIAESHRQKNPMKLTQCEWMNLCNNRHRRHMAPRYVSAFFRFSSLSSFICCPRTQMMTRATKINEVTVHVAALCLYRGAGKREQTSLIRWWTTFNLTSWVKKPGVIVAAATTQWLINSLWLSIKFVFVLLLGCAFDAMANRYFI